MDEYDSLVKRKTILESKLSKYPSSFIVSSVPKEERKECHWDFVLKEMVRSQEVFMMYNVMGVGLAIRRLL